MNYMEYLMVSLLNPLLEDKESIKVIKDSISKMEKRIRELEIRKKQLLIMFCKLAKNLAEQYLVNG